MNSKLLYILWKSVLSQSFGIMLYVFPLGWTRGIVWESAKIDLRQSDAYSMCYVGIKVREWIERIKMKCIAYAFLQKQSHTHTHTRAHKCRFSYLICVAWLILLGMLFGSAIVLFKHHIRNFDASRFCTLANNASCSSKREHMSYKNDTKWFGIKHSFIRCIIIYCS